MKKRKFKYSRRLCAALLLVTMSAAVFSGCKKNTSSTSTPDEAGTQASAELSTLQSENPTAPENTKNPNVSGGDVSSEPTGADLYCLEFASYSGVYVEDGKNEEVEDVAMILVENRSLQYLDQATITYIYGNKYATFVLTGLPAGEKCWVMEKNKLTVEDGYSFYFEDCVTSFKSEIIKVPEQLQVDAKDNTLTIENTSPNTLENVAVYYKNTYADGNYLGGITYVMNFGTMEPGDTICKESGHFSESSKVVRFSYQI